MPKVRTDYGKFCSDRKYEERAQQAIGFFDMLNVEHVEMKLTTGEILTGILETNGYDRYDVMLRNDEAIYVVRKDVLVYVKQTLTHNE